MYNHVFCFTLFTTEYSNIPTKLSVRLLLQLQVIARTVASLSPTDALDRSSGQAAAGKLVSRNARTLQNTRLANIPQVTSSSSVPVFPYNASLVNLNISETRTTGSGQAAAGELVSLKMQGLSRARTQLHIMNTFFPRLPSEVEFLCSLTLHL